MLPALIATGGSLLGSAFGWMSNSSTNAANMDIAKYQYQKNLEMWNRNNDYNKPESQMERLRAAGLNPNLVYGSGNVGGNASSTPPEFHAPTMQAYTNFGDMGASAGVDAYMRSKLLESDLQSKNAERIKMAAETNLLGLEATSKTADIAWKGIRNAKSQKELDVYADMLKADLNLKLKSIANLDSIITRRDWYENPLTLANELKVSAETDFIKGPQTRLTLANATSALASAKAAFAQASKTNWEESRSRQMFRDEVGRLRLSNRISDATLTKMEADLAYTYARIAETVANTGYITQKTLTEAQETLIKEWQAKYGVKVETGRQIAAGIKDVVGSIVPFM